MHARIFPHKRREWAETALRMLLAALIALVLLQAVAAACPTCRESLAQNDPAHANMVRGYFWSILFMMSMPFLIFGGLCSLFWWEIRKAKLQKLREAEAFANLPASKSATPVEERELIEV